MQISQSHKPHNRVDYYPLPNGYVDVFLHKNERTETEVERRRCMDAPRTKTAEGYW